MLFHHYILNPAAKRFAEVLWQTDRALLIQGAPDHDRAALEWRPGGRRPGKRPGNYFLQASNADLRRLSSGAGLRIGLNSQRDPTLLWVRDRRGQPWLGLRVSPVDFGGHNFLFIRVGIIAVVALFGAWLVVRQINRPLARLAAEAPRIGRGDTSDSLDAVGGPLEVQHLKEVILSMANDLHRLHEERMLLLTGISHELRTPLSRLLLTLHLQDEALLAERSAMCVDVSEMDETIEKFLTLVSGSGQEKVVPLKARAWIAAMAEIAQERYGLQVETDLAPEDEETVLYGRPLALERVFRILFDNTRRYGRGRMDIRIRECAGLTEVRLRDYGPGVAGATLMAMSNGTLPRQPGHGSGIGLRICHSVMALHGGALLFQNACDGGLVAILQFPHSPPPSAHREPRA